LVVGTVEQDRDKFLKIDTTKGSKESYSLSIKEISYYNHETS
jgi:hypothetical protein